MKLSLLVLLTHSMTAMETVFDFFESLAMPYPEFSVPVMRKNEAQYERPSKQINQVSL